jgi:hypothetical protein
VFEFAGVILSLGLAVALIHDIRAGHEDWRNS